MSITFTYAASDGDSTCIGIPCRCDLTVEPDAIADGCEHTRYELNVANGNGLAILRALELPADPIGTADPLVVLAALSTPKARNVSRHYLTRLRDLAADAVQRHVMIGWS